jgi:hypothetical protein
VSGYRNAGDGEIMPPPSTPLQRIGIACAFLGSVMIFAYLGGRSGLIPKWIGSPLPGAMLAVISGPLVGGRPGPLTPEARRRRLLIIAAALAVCAITAITIFYLKGA